MYKKQACIAEVRKKSRSREKEFLCKVQTALDEIGVSRIQLHHYDFSKYAA